MPDTQHEIKRVEDQDSFDSYYECITVCYTLAGEDIECITECAAVHLQGEMEC